MLIVKDLNVRYGRSIHALDMVSIDVEEGTVTAVLGVNGSGKSTLLRAICGVLPSHAGRVTNGFIHFEGKDITHARPATIAASGVALSPEGRRIFTSLTVAENLEVGGRLVSRRERATNRGRVVDLFPVLRDRRHQPAGLLSGGEQQMLAIARALMSSPRLLLLDEPSLGLAPIIVDRIATLITTINQQGTTVMLVEQNARMALNVAHRAEVLESGRVELGGPAADLRADPAVQALYLGEPISSKKETPHG